jgi:hypothetical protein
MGEVDWTELNDDLDLSSVDRGVTTGIARPNGGGAFAFGFNSLTTAQGACGYFTNQVSFAPTAVNKGGSARGAIQRGLSGGDINFAPMLYLNLQGPSVNDAGYLLGLQDDEPHRIALRKGTIVSGIPSASPGASGILRRSTATFTKGTWLHLRIDAVVNLNGDVILKVFRSDLVGNPVTAPVWVAEAGLEDPALVTSHGAGTAFVDDSLGVNSGSAPYTSGRMGYAFFTKDVTRRGFYDHLEMHRQT